MESGGERGIRTLEGLLTLTPLAGERFQPLSHLSIWSDGSGPTAVTAFALKVNPKQPGAHYQSPPTDWGAHSTDRDTLGKALRHYSPELSPFASPAAFSL